MLHLLYSRFITMVLKDLGHLDFEEPFTMSSVRTASSSRDGAKMSKSKGNVIVRRTPIIEEFGADTFRTYLMFLGPFEEGGDYRAAGDPGAVTGSCIRLWGHRVLDSDHGDGEPDDGRRAQSSIKTIQAR